MRHTILVVEDEVELREMVQEALELSGYRVVVAGDGQEALDLVGQIEHLCLVILDLVMPRMDGWDFLEKMRAVAGLTDVPVVVHCSAPNQAPAGATRILRKPVKLERLLSVVEEYCDRGVDA